MISPQLEVPCSLSSLPEELIACILEDCVSPPQVLPVRPSWHTLPPFFPCHSLLARPPPPSNTSRTRLSPLLVSRQFLRIGTPLYYQTLHLPTVTHAARVLEVLGAQPLLADAVRRVVLGCISLEGARVLRACERIEDVDICMDVGTEGNSLGNAAGDLDAEALCDALEQMDLKRLTIRKASCAYLTNMRPKYVLERIAKAVPSWPNLESVHYALKIGSSPATRPLAHALSNAPKLRILKAHIPAVWNDLFLTISRNSTLKHITLYAEAVEGIMHTSLYMMEAKKHARLSELIKAGTSFIRTRAHTTAAVVQSPPPTRPSTPLSAIRVKEVTAELMNPRLNYGAPFPVAARS
ncbi:hypothetical protein K503DRAFT_742559 [Rhizopogon vinicolor AM-OR11-026]|uniref:F-box domain-containing protein n=1 Tax=Rhizopogon vinicolor AM-OR11-026 TaxID=1314800 RepID=A0A1B7MY63_9AGAM|nr:hypothetical protein K503DRAFT_742559 [Rhizopogon vinicolor AM-OR11-026]